MRIIAGEFRGRKLLGPEGRQTRPITDRVKQSLFDILAPRIEGAVVYDCFAGTGSMGLECLSRGAAKVIFFERDRSAVKRLRENIEVLGVNERARVVTSDVFKGFSATESRPAEVGLADIVFVDPPYRFVVEESDNLRVLSEQIVMQMCADAVVVFRHDARDSLELPKLVRYDERTYGGMTLEFLRRSSALPND